MVHARGQLSSTRNGFFNNMVTLLYKSDVVPETPVAANGTAGDAVKLSRNSAYSSAGCCAAATASATYSWHSRTWRFSHQNHGSAKYTICPTAHKSALQESRRARWVNSWANTQSRSAAWVGTLSDSGRITV